MVKYFYNSTKVANPDLSNYTNIAMEQQNTILNFAKNNPDITFSSEDVARLFPNNTPITSIRRAVCNLKKEGHLIVVGRTLGSFNRPIFAYKFVTPVAVS